MLPRAGKREAGAGVRRRDLTWWSQRVGWIWSPDWRGGEGGGTRRSEPGYLVQEPPSDYFYLSYLEALASWDL